jgi:hypothetical protein
LAVIAWVISVMGWGPGLKETVDGRRYAVLVTSCCGRGVVAGRERYDVRERGLFWFWM